MLKRAFYRAAAITDGTMLQPAHRVLIKRQKSIIIRFMLQPVQADASTQNELTSICKFSFSLLRFNLYFCI